MEKDSFLDTNVIINYANYQKDKSREIITKCYQYLSNKQGRFIICYAVIRELENIISKLTVIHREVLKKIEKDTYHLGQSMLLSNRDLPIAEKLYLAHKETNEKKLKEIFSSERDIFEIEIERFLKNKIDIKVIGIDEIKVELVNALRDFIDNYADCKVLASALQYQKDKELFLFVTADKKDLNPNSYEYVQDCGILKEYKFPELLNLMFEK